MTQASQQFNGTLLYRWFVYVGNTRYVTWAASKEEAARKTERRRSLRKLRLRVDRIEPAPSLVK